MKTTSVTSINPHLLPRAALAILAGSIAAIALAPQANSATWTGTTSGAWTNTTKWQDGIVGGSASPATTDSSVVLFPANTAANTFINVTVDSGRNVGGLSFPANGANFGNYQFAGGPLVFSAGASVSVTGTKSRASFLTPITLLGDASLNTVALLSMYESTITGSAGPGVTNTVTVSTSGGVVVLGAVSDGSGGGKLALTSSGSVAFVSAASYSGNTTFNGGQLTADADNVLSPNSAIFLNNATLDLSNSSTQTVPSVHLTGTNQIVINNNRTSTLTGGIVSGPGGLSLSGSSSSASIFRSTSANTFTGDVTIDHAVFSVNALGDSATPQPLGQGGNPVALAGAGKLVYTGPEVTWNRGITSTGSTAQGIHNNGTGRLTLGGTISTEDASLQLQGSQPITVTGSIVGNESTTLVVHTTSVTLSNTNSFARMFIFNGGSLKGTVAGAIPAGTELSFRNSSNGTFDLNGFDSQLSLLGTISANTSFVTNGAVGSGTNVLTVGGGDFRGVIQDGATAKIALTTVPDIVLGTGLLLGGQNTYSGATTITTDSWLTANGENTLSPNSAVIMEDGSNLVLWGDQTVPSLSISGTPIIALNDFKLNVPTIGGTGGMSLQGGGTLTGANTFTGPVTISGGTVYLDILAGSDTPQPLGQGTAPVQFGTGGMLVYTGPAAAWDRGITVTDGTGTVTNNGTGTLTLGGTLSKDGTVLILTGSSPINVTGTIVGGSDNSDLVVDGAPVTLSNANSYNGPTYIINGGTLTAAVPGALPSDSALILDDTGTGSSKLILGADQTADSLSLPAKSTLLTEEYHLTLASDLTLAGTTAEPATLGFSLSGPNSGELLLSGGTFNGSVEDNSVALLIDAPGFTSGSISLIDWLGATPADVDLADFFLDPASNLPLDLSAYTLSINGSVLDISVAPVPEPGTAFFGLALVGLCAGRRRKTRAATPATVT